MPSVSPRIGTGERYATQMGELWSVLTRTLSRLDELAAEPERLDEETAPDTLRRLQYSLHAAGERVYGLAPPAGAEPGHAELWAALAGARDATAEVAEAIEDDGAEAVAMLVHEWRGALFRVRLARLRLSPAPELKAPEARVHRDLRTPVVAALLVSAGAIAFALGATTGHWPVWAAGMLAVCGAALVPRP
jgi:hypothetical protein